MRKTYSSIQEVEERFFPNSIRERIINSEDYEKIGKLFAEETLEKVRKSFGVKLDG